ncbi:MAG: chromosomal replication initiator protein DnaA [candidate division Zixibacteria bacterium]|nr:chromosomal replication initiator protein DnaA [candidate division Zixibacteria bacterium]
MERAGVKTISTAVKSDHWALCLEYMSHRVKQQSFNTWLKPTKGNLSENGKFVVRVRNQFVSDWLQNHFRELIEEAIAEILGTSHSLVFELNDESAKDQASLELYDRNTLSETTGNGNGNGSPRPKSSLSQRYDFKSLVVGDFNEFAYAAAVAVAEAPGTTRYNPLYIYGGTGLGKTHIVQALGNEIVRLFPDKRVVYATSEKFTSDFISSISGGSMADFTRNYRSTDVLIIDDAQFFTGKESTQEQFFHTFNTLYNLGKQIVLTSDRPPKEIKGLEERLLSRFSCGLVTDLQAPDLENRTAILYKKMESEGCSMPDDVLRYIASKVTTNVRELEGALIRLLAYSSLKKVEVNLEMAHKILSDSFYQKKQLITIDDIQKKTCDFLRIDKSMMRAKKKTSDVVIARQIAMYLSRSLTDSSLKSIGDAFGGRDHSTVIHACDMISRRMSSDSNFRERIDQLSASLLY